MQTRALPDWAGKISHHAQVGGIESMTLDNGAGRGTRVAWVNTGTGLRFKVVIDRGMDIADAFFHHYALGWISRTGTTAPQPAFHKGLDWLRGFGGGLLTTCGLAHVGGPDKDDTGERGLHGDFSNTPAELISVVQPDPERGQLDMSISGIIRHVPIFGPALELRRTISCRIGESAIRIQDEVTNRGNTPAPHMILYHCNFGWPLVDEGTDILWKGTLRHHAGTGVIFNGDHDLRKCPAPMADHSGSGEDVAFIEPVGDSHGRCRCGLHNGKLGLALVLRWSKEQLPWLTNWQHWGRGEYVTALEPGTHPPIGQAKARAEGTLVQLAPGEQKTYDLELEILTETSAVRDFLNAII
jgi:galactose mutarotase-like enzyme